jgi:hypothetical protein
MKRIESLLVWTVVVAALAFLPVLGLSTLLTAVVGMCVNR